MVDLPTINNGVPSVQAPQSRVPSISIRSPLRDVADAAETVAKEANDISKIMAKEAGLKSVTRDEQGNVQVDKYPIVGDAALAYKAAVQTAAVTDGETVAKRDLVDLQQKFKDDPEGFRNAAAEYRKTKVGQYESAAGAAVGLSLGKAIDNTAIEFYRGALNRKESNDLHLAASSIQAQINDTKNELFALANGGDQDSPEYRARLQKVGALWKELTRNPRMGVAPERVDYEIGQLQSELQVAGLDHRLQKIQAEKGVQAAYEEADKIRTDPSLNLTPGQRINYYSRAVGGIQQRVNAHNAIDKGTAAEINEIGKIAAEGYSVPTARMATVQRVVSESGNPALAQALRSVETVAPIVADWRKSSPAQLEHNLSQLDETMRTNGATPDLLALQKIGTKLLKNMRDGISEDPLGWSDRTGNLPVPPIDFTKPDAAAQMRDRASRAETIAGHYGVAPSYLKPDERAALQAVSAAGGKPMTDVAAAIVSGFGDRAPQVLTELGKESPVLAHVGGLMVSGGSPALVRDAADAVALRQNKDFKHPRWLDKESDAIQAAQNERTVTTYGNAFVLAPDTGRAAVQTANAAFFTRSMRQNYDPKFATGDTSGAKTAYDRTLQEAAGATFDARGVQYGGIADYKPGYWTTHKVLIPTAIRKDSFGSVIGALKDEDVAGAVAANGKPYTARDIQGAVPVATRGGYRFAVGDPLSDSPKWIRGADGKPFVLDIEAMEPVLRKRVPAAYIGQ